jgi:hypothetical protein
MSKLAELLQSRGMAYGPANHAKDANPQSEISSLSRISSGQPSNFTPALERRIRMMASRWQYSDVELADVLDRARSNPVGWLRAVALDEQREAEFRSKGFLS